MPYVVYCIDRPDAGDLRRRTRAVHLEYMIGHRDRILFGGPLQSEGDGRTIGSLMVLDFADRTDVEAFLSREPYTEAGLFADVRIARLRPMVPEDPPGLLTSELARARASA